MSVGDESYAVHWIPPDGTRLAAFGCRWTGWCPETHEDHPRIATPAEGLDLAALTRDIGRYGFHAELKAPFRLKNRRKIWLLERTLALLADLCREVAFRGLELAVVDGRVSLVPRGPAEELDALARRVREALDPLTLPQQQRLEQAARRVPGLAKRLGVALRPPGSFHMPLTDRLPLPAACQIAGRLRPLVGDLLQASHVIADIALVTDPGIGGRTRIEERYPLSDEVARGGAYSCRGPKVFAPLIELDPTGLTPA